MSQTIVWAFQPLPELNMQTGFVECGEGLAADLIKSGRAQNPKDGALCLKNITNKPEPEKSSTYDTKVMTPEKRSKPRKPTESDAVEAEVEADKTDVDMGNFL
jgi:hypothetical protein